MPINRADLLKSLLPHLERIFDVEYGRGDRIEYHMKYSYGKYSIYKWEFEQGEKVKSTTLAKKLSKEEASGMMKLLKEPEYE